MKYNKEIMIDKMIKFIIGFLIGVMITLFTLIIIRSCNTKNREAFIDFLHGREKILYKLEER